MTLILQGTTKTKDLIIDYIEVQLSSGKTVSLNWDESGIDRTPEGFDAKYKGIYLNGEYANGRLDELRGMQVVDLGLYSESESTASLVIDEMAFTDGEDELLIAGPVFEVKERMQMAKKVQKSASEQLIEEIQTLGQTQGLNNVFTTFLEMLAVSLNAQVDSRYAEEREKRYQQMVSGNVSGNAVYICKNVCVDVYGCQRAFGGTQRYSWKYLSQARSEQ